MRQDVFAVKPRAIGGDEVQPAGHDICVLTARVATMALLQRCLAVHLYVLPRDGVGCGRDGVKLSAV